MNFPCLISLFTHSTTIILCFIMVISCSKAQQQYSGNSVLTCNSSEETTAGAPPSPAFLYSCNGEHTSCRAFLIFRALYPYISVPMISTLTSSDQSEIARLNNVTIRTVFPQGTEVIVPVNCSCSATAGKYYQATAKYDIQKNTDTFFTIANNTYQGLSTCDSLKKFRLDSEESELEVPLRCACPTKKQAADGIQYLITYSVTWNDDVSLISKSFNVSRKIVTDANGFLDLESEVPTIFPFTTILIPLPNEPLSRVNFTPKTHPNPNPNPNRTSSVSSSLPRSRKNLPVGGLIAAGSTCLLLFVAIFFIFKTKMRRICGIQEKGNAGEDDGYSKDIHVEIASIDRFIRIYKYQELKKATGNFCSKSRIEGSVYRGVLHKEKEIIAIKKMSTEPAAYNEVNMLSRMNHFNLIKLLGYCEHYHHHHQGDQFLFFLVFEYMKNGSLRQWLHSKETKMFRNGERGWLQRIQIALDIASGLLYLHNFAKPAYIHKDINSSNILLDSNLRAKISNFGFARTSSDTVTRRVVGTKGYMAPEYIKTGLVTQKVDVYAFGVVLLELITGKDAVVVRDGRDILLGAEIAEMVVENGVDGLRNLVEPDLGEDGRMEYAFQIVYLSLSCLMQNPVNRPSMDDIVSNLIKIQRNMQKSDCPEK